MNEDGTLAAYANELLDCARKQAAAHGLVFSGAVEAYARNLVAAALSLIEEDRERRGEGLPGR